MVQIQQSLFTAEVTRIGATIRSFDIAPPRFLTVTEACNEKRLKKTETVRQSTIIQENAREKKTWAEAVTPFCSFCPSFCYLLLGRHGVGHLFVFYNRKRIDFGCFIKDSCTHCGRFLGYSL